MAVELTVRLAAEGDWPAIWHIFQTVVSGGDTYAYAPDTFATLVAGKQVPTLFEVYLSDPGKIIDQGVAP